MQDIWEMIDLIKFVSYSLITEAKHGFSTRRTSWKIYTLILRNVWTGDLWEYGWMAGIYRVGIYTVKWHNTPVPQCQNWKTKIPWYQSRDFFSSATRIRTLRWRSQSPLPYRLAMALFFRHYCIVHDIKWKRNKYFLKMLNWFFVDYKGLLWYSECSF